MRIKITTVSTIDNSMLVSFHGIWNTQDTAQIADLVQANPPTYLIVDPTECIFTDDVITSIDKAPKDRQILVNRIASVMQQNPQMLYIIINSNETDSLKTSVLLYQEMGIEDRYIFVKSLDEAIETIHQHQAKL